MKGQLGRKHTFCSYEDQEQCTWRASPPSEDKPPAHLLPLSQQDELEQEKELRMDFFEIGKTGERGMSPDDKHNTV
jgi:hypothetical protein